MTTVLGVTLPVKASETYRDTWSDQYELVFTALGNEQATKTVDLVFADKILSRPVLKDYGETVQTVTITANAATIDCTLGNHAITTMAANLTTLTLSNPSPTGTKCAIVWEITQGGAGSFTITWPASVKWAGGAAPVLSTAVGAIDEIVLTTRNAGTSWLGSARGTGFA